MSALPKTIWTPESYLEFEASSPIRHEYFEGEIFAMAGATRKHVLITGSTYATLYNHLKKRHCEVYSADMRLKITAFQHYTYPDIMVVCGTPLIDKRQGEQLLNPTVIIEVASPSTEDYDRGTKFTHYRSLASLQDYLVISQERVHIEHHRRQEGGWFMTETDSLEDKLVLVSIECELAVADVYEKISFAPNESSEDQSIG